MQGFVANTDYAWYTYLRERQKGVAPLDEVNFWQPSAHGRFRAVPPGAPFFFKLKKPHDAIAGFGHFAYFSVLSVWLAWDTFADANGTGDFHTLNRQIAGYRRLDHPDPAGRYEIGCIMLGHPVFFEERDWIPQPRDWKPNVVRGSTYDLAEGEGRRIWDACRLLAGKAERISDLTEESLVEDRYGSPQLIRPRLGQGSFRIAVTDAYDRACAVTQEHSLPVLEAAHIKSYAEGGPHALENGILLRSDIHRLFDKGYVTVTDDLRFEVSSRLETEFANGRSYYHLHGTELHLPERVEARPSPDYLIWHNEQVYRS
jgi:putative restriction endonuclease